MAVVNLSVDLDIDSNNDGSISDADDPVEDIAGDDARPGKIVLVSNMDTDKDGLLDWVDGFNWRPGTTDDASTGTSFVPMRLTLPPNLNLASTSIELQYDDSFLEGIAAQKFKELLDAASGGTSSQATDFVMLGYTYRRLIPRMAEPHWQGGTED